MGAIEKKLYILHGWTTDITRWNPFLEALKKENVTPIMLPIPGLTSPIDKPWTLDNYVEWLYQQVHNDIKIALFGHSNGGRIALAFAHTYPEEVGQLFLVDSAGLIHNDIFSKMKRGIFRGVAKVGKTLTQSETAKHLLYKAAQENDYKNATPIQRETMKNLITTDLLPILHEVKTPTILIWGKDDIVTPYTDALVMKNTLPNSQLFTIKGGRHSPQFTHIPEVVQIIKEHII